MWTSFSAICRGSRTLLIYYVEERLAFNDKDVANLFVVMGMLGMLIQGVLLKYINDGLGEKNVVVVSFVLVSSRMISLDTHTVGKRVSSRI